MLRGFVAWTGRARRRKKRTMIGLDKFCTICYYIVTNEKTLELGVKESLSAGRTGESEAAPRRNSELCVPKT